MPGRFNKDDYIAVQERINRFWSEYPDGAIVTDTHDMRDFDQTIIRAEVYKHKDDQRPSATGIAAEERGADARSGANFTSWHENAETSAIGRALANMGYATSHQNRPSYEEMDKVERMENMPARTRTTSQNTVPDTGPVGEANTVVAWTDFWDRVEAMGLPRDSKAFIALTGVQLGSSPALALEKAKAWAHDNPVQQVTA